MSARAHPRAHSWLALTAHPGRLFIIGDTSESSQEPRSYSDAQNSRAVPVSRHGTFSFPGLLTDSAHASHVSSEPLRGRTAPETSPNGGSAGVPGRGVCPTHCSERPRGWGPVAKQCLCSPGGHKDCALPVHCLSSWGSSVGQPKPWELIAPGAERESGRPS